MNPDYRVQLIQGKLLSQSCTEPTHLRELIQSFGKKHPDISPETLDEVKSSLLWRLAISETAFFDRNAQNSLSQQEEHKATRYQSVHNAQCRAINYIYSSSHRGNLNTHSATDLLTASFFSYSDLENFQYIEKCLASNLIFQSVINLESGRSLRSYKAILAARFIFEEYNIYANAEAIAEVVQLLLPKYHELHNLLFGDLENVVKCHSRGTIIRELDLEIKSELLSDPNLHRAIVNFFKQHVL